MVKMRSKGGEVELSINEHLIQSGQVLHPSIQKFADSKKLLNREYVIVCNRHKGLAGALNFWGVRTKDDQKRSFGGYTSDLNTCEVYAIGDINRNDFPVYGEDFKPDDWRKQSDFCIRIDQLEELGYRPLLIYYR